MNSYNKKEIGASRRIKRTKEEGVVEGYGEDGPGGIGLLGSDPRSGAVGLIL